VADDRTVAEIELLEAQQPALVALARLASVAAIIEPPLLRRLRLKVGGLARKTLSDSAAQDWHAGMEADLWLSELAHVATPSQLTLRPAILEVLRDQLSQPKLRPAAEQARDVVADAHHRHSEMLQLEEEIIWASVSGDTDAVGAALERALATLRTDDEERATGLVRWFTQARRRIPASALRHPTGRLLLAAAAMHLDRVIPREFLEADRFPDAVADLVPSALPTVETGIILTGNGIRFTTPDDPKAGRLTIPDTRPRVVEVTWHSAGSGEWTTLAQADNGDYTPLPDMTGEVALRTLSGQRFAVRSAEARHVVVAVIGFFSTPIWGDVADALASLLTRTVADPDITVGITRDPRDLYERPQVVVVGHVRDDYSLSDFTYQVERAVTRRRKFGTSAPPVLHVREVDDLGQLVPTKDRGAGLIVQFKNKLGDALEVVEIRGESRLTEQVAEVIRTAAATPSDLYALDVDTALTMLNSVALAFHVRGLYGDSPNDAELFGFPVDISLEDVSYESAPKAFNFRHVRVLCEWLFAGPVRDYLAGGTDPTDVDVDTRPQVSAPGWSPGNWGWDSFADYLEWFVHQLSAYATTLRDRLGQNEIQNRYAVPTDALEIARLAVGTAALPLGSDEATSSLYHSSRSDDTDDEVYYSIERAELPKLIGALAKPILAAAAAEADRRDSDSVESGPDLTVSAQVRGPEISFDIENHLSGEGFIRETDHDPPRVAQVRSMLAHYATQGREPDFIGAGRELSDLLPEEFWRQLNLVNADTRRDAPRVQVERSVEMLWETIAVDPPVAPSLPPFLGCQSAIAVWPREISGPKHTETTAFRIDVLEPRSAEVSRESEVLVSRYGVRRITTFGEALEALQDIHILHLSGHSLLEGPPFSDEQVVLADRQQLSVLDFANTRLASSSFVFLSTKQAPASVLTFLKVGAAAVVAPMWTVPAEEASRFVSSFYEGVLDRGLPVAEVLRQLRCAGGSRGSHALAYRLFGSTDFRVRYRPAAAP
jgi:hypothetical protein